MVDEASESLEFSCGIYGKLITVVEDVATFFIVDVILLPSVCFFHGNNFSWILTNKVPFNEVLLGPHSSLIVLPYKC